MEKLALLGGTPVRSKPFPSWPRHDRREREGLLRVLESGNWGGFPFPNTEARELGRRFAAAHGARHGIALTNGTVALEVALRALDLEPGDEVVVPAYTWEGTAAAALFAGLTPVFADSDPRTYCLDPAALEAAIGPRTRAVIPVHLGMNMTDMDAVGEIAGSAGWPWWRTAPTPTARGGAGAGRAPWATWAASASRPRRSSPPARAAW